MSKWHGGKGSKPRPITNQKQFEDNWDKIFGRKKTPDHAKTKVHEDKTKTIPRRKKYDDVDNEG